MAQKIITTMVSDLPPNTEEDRENGVTIETVEFGLDGAEFEIDLTGEEAAGLRDALADFVAAARKSGGTRRRGVAPTRASRSAVTNAAKASGQKATATGSTGTTRPKLDRTQSQAIREWGKAQGFEVSDRGRIPVEVQEAYERAHGSRSVAPSRTPRPSPAEPPTADSAPAEGDGDGTGDLVGWNEPTRPLSAVPDVPEGDDPADNAAEETASAEKIGKDGLTHSRREAIREFLKKQGIEVRDKGILKKDAIATAVSWENTHGSLDVAPAETPDDDSDDDDGTEEATGPAIDELRSMLP